MSSRPLRSAFESITDRVPRGPLGFIGGGNAVGAVNYFTVALINGIIPIDGIDVGFNVESHSVRRTNGDEIHTFIINAANKDVARFIAKFRSAPSNIDFALRETEIESINLIDERRTFSTWEITTRTSDRDNVPTS